MIFLTAQSSDLQQAPVGNADESDFAQGLMGVWMQAHTQGWWRHPPGTSTHSPMSVPSETHQTSKAAWPLAYQP